MAPLLLTLRPRRTTPESIWSAHEAVRRGDPVGHAIHTVLAMAYLLLLSLGTSPKEFAWGALAVWTLIRAPRLWRSTSPLFRDPLLLVWAAWIVWHLVTLLWSADRAAGLDEVKAARVIFTPLMLWPVIDRAPWLVGAYLAGVFGLNLVQVAQQLHWFGMSPNLNERLCGWQHPILTAVLCLGAVCWHLSAMVHWRPTRTRREWIVLGVSIVGLAAAGGGLVFSGSRGPWIAAAISVPACIVVIGLRRPATRPAAVVLMLAGLVSSVAAWPLAGDLVRQRTDGALTEVRRALDEGDYDSNVGKRLAIWSAAWKVYTSAPLAGVGVGSYDLAAADQGYGGVLEPDEHAHSMYLHELATAGTIGIVFVGAIVLMSLRRAWRAPPVHRYADGTFFVLIGWLIGTTFDCYNLSGTTFGLFGFIVALTMPYRPAAVSHEP